MVYPRIEIIKYKNKMRLNPETGDRFRHGDLREDGFVFDHYNAPYNLLIFCCVN